MYIRYEDAKKLRDRIKTMHDLGYTEAYMADILEVSRPRVAYHLRKLALTKLNSKHNFRLCSACNKRPIEFSYICRNNECFDIFLDALTAARCRGMTPTASL